MKKSFILSAILFGSLVYTAAEAQISVHIGVNVPVRRVYVPAPAPRPVIVYDNNGFDDVDDYYYLPDVEAYYSIPTRRYYYMDGGRWISAAYLPGAYRNYDWRTARRFEVRGRRPFLQHDVYRSRWGGGFSHGDWNRRVDNYYADRRFNNNRNNWNRGDNNRYNQPNRHNEYRGDRNNGSWGQQNQPRTNNDNRGGGRPSNNGGDRDRGGRSNMQFAENRGGQGGEHRQARF